MTETLTPAQLDAIDCMPAEQRYDYFINKLIELGEVWGLSSDTGWVILSDEDDEQLPVWPHAQLAESWARGEFSDCQPKAIPLTDWINKWLTGMEKDGLLAAVCPSSDGDSIIVGAEELLHDIKSARDA